MEQLILRCRFSVGDIVLLTAAVRDLHRWYPGRFQTDVRTHFPDLWLHNPYLTALSESDPTARVLHCRFPLIDVSNQRPYHCLHGFQGFLNERLNLRLSPTSFHGDIHLTRAERSAQPLVHELAGCALPYWLIAAGGKYDLTTKWWPRDRYQAVVDHFRDRLQFVQVGAAGHHHPKLKGVIDLRGRTTLRELLRLVYHAQGVVCPITALMHLAAAVPRPPQAHGLRPCVVIAGGREPVHWEAYPGHQFLHTIGALPCCAHGGCWKDRTHPLGDGHDRGRTFCVDVAGTVPRCLDLITPEDVARRIELYLAGGKLPCLRGQQVQAARQGVAATRNNRCRQRPD